MIIKLGNEAEQGGGCSVSAADTEMGSGKAGAEEAGRWLFELVVAVV